MTRRIWALGLAACAVAGFLALLAPHSALAKPGIVKTIDGQTLEGDIDNDKVETVTINGKGGATVLPREKVASIEFVSNIEQEYKIRAAKLSKTTDAPAHVELARWLFDNKAYDLARTELDIALTIDSNNPEANTLYQTVIGQQRLDRNKPAAGTVHQPAATEPRIASATTVPATGMSPATHTASERNYLKPADINLIRESEWRSEDTGVKASVDAKTRAKYLDYVGGSPADFNKLSSTDQALAVLEHGLPEMKKGITVATDPEALAQYKKVIQPIILSGCASIGCHGGPNGGNFFLYPDTSSNEAAYTNFYLLASYRKTDEYGQQRFMIDRTYPDQSLLLQYSLSSDLAQARHPDVPKGTAWRGLFKGKSDEKYRTIAAWMSKSLRPVAPEYDIHFSLTSPPATRPAGAP